MSTHVKVVCITSCRLAHLWLARQNRGASRLDCPALETEVWLEMEVWVEDWEWNPLCSRMDSQSTGSLPAGPVPEGPQTSSHSVASAWATLEMSSCSPAGRSLLATWYHQGYPRSCGVPSFNVIRHRWRKTNHTTGLVCPSSGTYNYQLVAVGTCRS